VIIVGQKQKRITGRAVDLYENCRIFTVLSPKMGTRKQQKIFEERHVLDHLWISDKCTRWNKAIAIPEIFAIGKIDWYEKKGGIKDLELKPVDYKTHLEKLFVGIVFMYGLHIIEEAKLLTSQDTVTKNYEHWHDQLVWLQLITERFKEIIQEKKIELEKPLTLKYIDCFLKVIEIKTSKARSHVKKIENKKGFKIHKLKYI
jgi:hypothetical protein